MKGTKLVNIFIDFFPLFAFFESINGQNPELFLIAVEPLKSKGVTKKNGYKLFTLAQERPLISVLSPRKESGSNNLARIAVKLH